MLKTLILITDIQCTMSQTHGTLISNGYIKDLGMVLKILYALRGRQIITISFDYRESETFRGINTLRGYLFPEILGP